jgi:hypothetical protein
MFSSRVPPDASSGPKSQIRRSTAARIADLVHHQEIGRASQHEASMTDRSVLIDQPLDRLMRRLTPQERARVASCRE